MGDPFFSSDHAHQKLHNTVCMYNKVPYYVTVDRIDTVTLHDLTSGVRKKVLYTDTSFDYTHVPLGYINYHNTAYYLTRDPRRINQQGLSPIALMAVGNDRLSFNDLMFSKAFKDCVMGEHPTFGEALARLLGDTHKKVAVSRHVALSRITGTVYAAEYRGRIVALSQDKGVSFKITDSQAEHLIQKRLSKNGVPVI